MSWVTDIARAEIRELRAYEHASWEPGLIRLHANESPWRCDSDRSVEGLNRYPEPHPYALIARLAQFYGVPGDCVLASRGSDEAIDLLIRAYCRSGEGAVVVTPPTFGMYSVAARIQGAAVVEVPLLEIQDFALNADGLRAAFTPAVRLIFLCSPNNPTGNLLATGQVLRLAREAEGRALVVVDEAYVEFAGCESLAAAVQTHPGLVVLRTLSKAHALAGARCGALIAQPEIIALLHKVIQPYAVTQLSIEAVFAALQPAGVEAARHRVSRLVAERARLAAALTSARSVVRVWPSDANFLLVRFQDAADALQRTHSAGLLVRDFSSARGLGQSLRISVGAPEQNDRLIASLAA